MKAAGLLVAVLVAGALPAAAQQVTLEPSAALRCLSPARAERGEPEYPLAAWKEGRGAYIKVEYVFHAANRAPEVKVLSDAQDPAFANEIRGFARQLRVPCLTREEAPARITQEYVFQPETRFVTQGLPSDPSELERLNMLGCITHKSGKRHPSYPDWALRESLRGRVLLRMRFSSPSQPPEVQVVARPYVRHLADDVRAWAADYRMPCHQGEPVSGQWTYAFVLEGYGPYGFKPLTLRQFLPMVRNIRLQRLAFDTTKMACPFDVEFGYRQPELPNVVIEAGTPNPARAALIEWLREADLDLPQESLDAVFLDTTVLSVPCIKIDFKPKE